MIEPGSSRLVASPPPNATATHARQAAKEIIARNARGEAERKQRTHAGVVARRPWTSGPGAAREPGGALGAHRRRDGADRAERRIRAAPPLIRAAPRARARCSATQGPRSHVCRFEVSRARAMHFQLDRWRIADRGRAHALDSTSAVREIIDKCRARGPHEFLEHSRGYSRALSRSHRHVCSSAASWSKPYQKRQLAAVRAVCSMGVHPECVRRWGITGLKFVFLSVPGQTGSGPQTSFLLDISSRKHLMSSKSEPWGQFPGKTSNESRCGLGGGGRPGVRLLHPPEDAPSGPLGAPKPPAPSHWTPPSWADPPGWAQVFVEVAHWVAGS